MNIFGLKDEEKKVEYIELIYDLIFVYIIGRNNSILHYIEGGFIPGSAFASYILGTLVILQIWYYTTLFINRYGENDKREYLLIFVNMFLLYYMAEGTRVSWTSYYVEYCTAWGLILLNLSLHYYLKLRETKASPWEGKLIKTYLRVLLIQAAAVFISIPLNMRFGLYLGPFAMLLGFIVGFLSDDVDTLLPIDFAHLSERVMLYIVFTFGEMIIAIAGYFEGAVTLSSVYYALMSFLIVGGLFVSYGYSYDHLIDREAGGADSYMLVHIFMIAALSCITTALEFMREPEVSAVPKVAFLVASFLVYFLFLAFTLRRYGIEEVRERKGFFTRVGLLSAAFALGMVLTYKINQVSIALTVLYVFGFYLLAVRDTGRKGR